MPSLGRMRYVLSPRFGSFLICISVLPVLTKTKQKSAALLAAIKEYDQNKWKVIGQKVGKPAKVGYSVSLCTPLVLSKYHLADGYQACEQYAKEHFGGRA